MHRALHLGEVATRHDGRGLVVDDHLEGGGAPVNELDGALGLDRSRSTQLTSLGTTSPRYMRTHAMYFTVARVALDHHVGRLEHGRGDLGHGELLVVGLLGGDHGANEHSGNVDARVRHEVGLERVMSTEIGTVEAERSRDRRDDLGDEAVQVGVRGALDVEVAAADVVEGLVVDHEGDVRVLEHTVLAQAALYGSTTAVSDLRGRVDRELASWTCGRSRPRGARGGASRSRTRFRHRRRGTR